MVNINKIKILVFFKGLMIKREFYFRNEIIENVKEFKYFGIVFLCLGFFRKVKIYFCE